MQNILCPLDFSETSMNAVQYAVNIAEHFQANLIFMFILSKKNTGEVVSRAEAEKRMNELSAKLGKDLKSHFTTYQTVILQGGVVNEIAEYVEENNIDLVVKGTNAIKDGGEEQVNSITYDVILKSRTTVLSIPKECNYEGFKKIVYASNFEKSDLEILQSIISLATLFDSFLHVVHFSVESNEKDEEDFWKFRNHIESYLSYPKMKIERKIYQGDLGQSLHEYIKDLKGGLLILASKQRNFISSLFHKSLTKQLSYSMDYPLWVYNI
ncbi:MAG: universal stress protein [Bacteroidota bacterium]